MRAHAGSCGAAFASGDVQPGDKPDQRDKKLAKAMEKMFRNYPPQS